jgi:PAS domain S-box-containing protein
VVNPIQDALQLAPAAAAQAEGDPFDSLPAAYVEADAQGTVTRVNSCACAAFGLRREEFVGRSGWELLAGDELKRSQEEFKQVLESSQEPQPVRRTIRSKDGHYRIYELLRSVIRDSQGKPVGVRHVAVDVTETVVRQEKEERNCAWLASVLDSLGDAVVVTDALGFVCWANPMAEDLTGWKSAEMMGKTVERLLPILSYEPVDGVPLSHRAMLEQQLRGNAVILDRKRYQLRVEIATSPILEKDSGYTAGIVRILRPLPEPQA